MGKAKKVLANTFFLFLDWLGVSCLGYLFWLALGKLLLPSEVGTFSTILNLSILISGVASLGLTTALPKLIPQYQAKNQKNLVTGTIWWTFKVMLLVNFLVASAILLLSSAISSTGYLTVEQCILLSASILSFSLFQILGIYLYSLQQMKKLFLTDSLASLLKLIVSVLLIFLGFSYLGPIAGLILSSIIVFLFRLNLLPRGEQEINKKEIWHYAIPAFFALPGSVLIGQGSIIALSFLKHMGEVGLFTIPFVFASPIMVVTAIINQAIFPITSEQHTLKEKESLKNLVSQSIRYSLLFTLPLIFSFLIFSREIMLVLASYNYITTSSLLPILSFAYLFLGLGSILLGVIYAVGEVKINRNIWLTGGVLNLVFCILLTPLFGAVGAALAYIACSAFIFFVSLFYAHKIVKFSLNFKNLCKIFIASISFLLVLLLFEPVIVLTTPFLILVTQLVFIALFAGIIYFLVLLFLKFFNEYDIRILNEFKEKSPKFKSAVEIFERILLKFIE